VSAGCARAPTKGIPCQAIRILGSLREKYCDVWTTANFKETQLRKMHVGQRVTIEVDSLDESFDGEVEYMPAATGDRSACFRPRMRIRFKPNQRDLDNLRPGMSVEPKVHLN
jgi:membrane fusion protein, multidrug efflux system